MFNYNKANQLYEEKEYDECIEYLYFNTKIAKIVFWSLILLSFILSGLVIYLSNLGFEREGAVAAVAVAAVVAFAGAGAGVVAVAFAGVVFGAKLFCWICLKILKNK